MSRRGRPMGVPNRVKLPTSMRSTVIKHKAMGRPRTVDIPRIIRVSDSLHGVLVEDVRENERLSDTIERVIKDLRFRSIELVKENERLQNRIRID